jgi:hypothetical protein
MERVRMEVREMSLGKKFWKSAQGGTFVARYG